MWYFQANSSVSKFLCVSELIIVFPSYVSKLIVTYFSEIPIMGGPRPTISVLISRMILPESDARTRTSHKKGEIFPRKTFFD